MLAGRFGAVQRRLALRPIEAREMPARERGPEHAVAVDVAAARTVSRHRRLVELGERRARGVGPRIDAHHVARKSERRAPYRAVLRINGDAIETGDHALVLGRIERLVPVDVIVAAAVAVSVEHERRPALRLLLVAGFLEELAVEPAEHRVARTAGARPQRLVRVLREGEVVRIDASANEREPAALRVVHREMAVRAFQGKYLVFAAEVRVARRPHARGEPDAA